MLGGDTRFPGNQEEFVKSRHNSSFLYSIRNGDDKTYNIVGIIKQLYLEVKAASGLGEFVKS